MGNKDGEKPVLDQAPDGRPSRGVSSYCDWQRFLCRALSRQLGTNELREIIRSRCHSKSLFSILEHIVATNSSISRENFDAKFDARVETTTIGRWSVDQFQRLSDSSLNFYKIFYIVARFADIGCSSTIGRLYGCSKSVSSRRSWMEKNVSPVIKHWEV